MNDLQILNLGKPYPFPIKEGATANFLTKSGNVLQIGLSGITKEEVYALKKNPVKIGIIVDQPLILFLFDFGDGCQYDCPFDVRLYSGHQLAFPDVSTEEQRLFIELHVVELSTNLIKVLRAFTLPHELTVKFLSAAKDQLASPMNEAAFNSKLQKVYAQDILDLLKQTKLYSGGS